MTGRLIDIEKDDRADAYVARVHGEIDSSNVSSLLSLPAETKGGVLVLDLTDAQYMDSSGIAAIVQLHRSVDLYLVIPPTSLIRRTLEIAGIDQLASLFDRLDDLPLYGNGAST